MIGQTAVIMVMATLLLATSVRAGAVVREDHIVFGTGSGILSAFNSHPRA